MSETTRSTSDLLARHAGWMRALSRELVSDPEMADDLAQDAALAALERPPSDAGRMRGWIARVMRNLFRERLRAGESRRAREAASARSEAEPAGDELVDRVHTQQRVARLLLEVEEPYRTALMLRFYANLPPRRIAAREGVPVATVKSRLHRGLGRLRERLDRSFDGDRRAWLAALAPWMRGLDPVGAAAGVSLTAKVLLVAGLLVLAGAWVALDRLVGDPAPPEDGREEAALARPSAGSGEATAEAEPASAARHAVDARPLEASGAGTWRLAIERGAGRVRGRVLDSDSGRGVPDAEVQARPFPGALPEGFELAEDRGVGELATVTDEGGRFRLEDVPEGPYEIEVSDPGGRPARELAAVSARGTFLQLWLGRPPRSAGVEDLAVLVVDAREEPVAGAEVCLRGSGREAALRGGDGWTRTSDARGWARFEGAGLRRGVLLARGPSGRVGRVDLFRDDGIRRRMRGFADGDGGVERGIELVLREPGAIEGSVRGGPGSLVRAWASSWATKSYAATRIPFEGRADEQGRFRIDGLAAGTYEMSLAIADDGRLRMGWEAAGASGRIREYEPVRVEVSPGSAARVELVRVEGPVLEGRVVRAGSLVPVAGARVSAVLPQGMESDPDRVRRRGVHLWRLDGSSAFEERSPHFSAETSTDEAGLYRLVGLPPGPDWRIEVFAAGLAFDRRQDVALEDGATASLEHALEAAGGIQGVAPSWAVLGLRREAEESFRISFQCPRTPLAPFAIPGLAAGAWEIAELHSDEARPPVSLETVVVRAGELTWVDLTGARPHRVEGRVTLRGLPVPGAILSFHGPQVVCDESGRFAWRYSFPYPGRRGLDLIVPDRPDAVTLRVQCPGMCDGHPGRLWEIRLPEGALAVEVLDAAGQPLECTVELETLETAQVPSSFGLAGAGGPETEAAGPAPAPCTVELLPAWSRSSTAVRRTDARGRARFELVPAGRYRIRAQSPDDIWLPPLELAVAEGEETAGVLEAMTVGAGARLELRVEEADGSPIRGREVVLRFDGGGADPLEVRRWTDAKGELRVEGAPPGSGSARLLEPFGASPSRVDFALRAGETSSVRLRRVAGR